MKKTSFLKRIFASIITVATVTTLATASLTQSAFAEDYSGTVGSIIFINDGDTVGYGSIAIMDYTVPWGGLDGVPAVSVWDASCDYIRINATCEVNAQAAIEVNGVSTVGTIVDSEISGYFYGIRIRSDSSIGSIDNVTIICFDSGIYNDDSTITSIRNSEISGGQYGIYSDTSSGIGSIDNVTISNANSGIFSSAGLIGNISNSTITGCGSYGIFIQESATTISNVKITNCRDGIYDSSGSLSSVTGCDISGCSRYALYNVSNVSDTTISSSYIGVFTGHSFSNVEITGCTIGFYNSFSFDAVSVTDCKTALLSTYSSATYNFLGVNTIEGSSYSIYNESYGFTLTSYDSDGNLGDATVNLTGAISASSTDSINGYITFDSGNYTLNGGASISAYSLNINGDACLTLTGDMNFSITDNYVTNDGTLTLTSGTLDMLIKGEGEIMIAEGGTVSAHADYIDNEVTINGSLSLTGGTVSSDITVAESSSLSTTTAFTLADEVSVSSSSITLTSTSAGTTVEITDWTGESISGASFTNASVTISNQSDSDAATNIYNSTFSGDSGSLRIVGTSSSSLANIGSISYATIEDTDSYGLYAYYANIGSISDVSIKDTGNYGLFLYRSNIGSISDVSIKDTDSYGVYLNYATIDSISNVSIKDVNNNGLVVASSEIGSISNVSIEDISSSGLSAFNSYIESISNVKVKNAGAYGLFIRYSDTLTNIDDVTVTNTGNDALCIYGSSTIDSITNVTVNGSGSMGLDLHTNVTTIGDCYFADCSTAAINVCSGFEVGRIENVVIENCGSYGIQVGDSTSSSLATSVGVIDNVTITSSSTASGTGGIYVYDYSSVDLVSNSTISGGYYGIYGVRNISSCDISADTTGVTVTTDSTGITEISNTSINSNKYGISVSDTTTLNFLGENTIAGSSNSIYSESYGFTLTSLAADDNLANATVNLTGAIGASTTDSNGIITFDSGNYILNGGSAISSYTLNINENASLTLTGDINISTTDNYVSNNGTLTLTSGTLGILIQGNGDIVIADNGSVSANADYLGNEVSNNGTLTLTSGTLNSKITNLGTLAVDASYLGDSYIDNSQGTISLTGGTIEISLASIVGAIEVTAGAEVSSSASLIDSALTNKGTLTLTGTSTLSGSISNSGTILADASYLSSEVITNTEGSIFGITGGTIETSLASIGGTIEVATGAEVSSSASYIDSALSNKGTLTLTGTSALSGSISNSGTILADAAYLGSEDITNTAGSIFGITGGTIESSLVSVGASIQITDGAEVSSSAANIDTALTNAGTLSLTSGTLGAAITGEGSTEIAADNSVSTDAAYLGTALTNNGTLSLTGGTLSSDISMAEGASLSTTEAVTLASGASVSSSSITLTGTGDGTTANIEDWSGDSISNATISKASVTISSSTVEATTQAVAFSLVRTGAADETVTPEGASFTGTDFVDTSFIMEDGSTLTLTNVSLDADCSIVVNSGDSASIDATNLSLSTSDISMVGNTLTIGTFAVDGLTVNVDGTFTVNLGMSEEDLAAFQEILAEYDSINFVFAGVESYEEVEELKIAILDNTSLDVSEGAAYDLSFTGSDLSSADGSLNITISSADIIPEPSTATLSLLALTALLARRKRRASLR